MRLFREVKESDDPKYTVISEGEHYYKQWVCDVEPTEITEEEIEGVIKEWCDPELAYIAAAAILSKLKGDE